MDAASRRYGRWPTWPATCPGSAPASFAGFRVLLWSATGVHHDPWAGTVIEGFPLLPRTVHGPLEDAVAYSSMTLPLAVMSLLPAEGLLPAQVTAGAYPVVFPVAPWVFTIAR